MRLRYICLAAALLPVVSCGPPEIIVTPQMSVVNWSPHDGASGIERASMPSVCLSSEVDSATLTFVSLRAGEAEPGSLPSDRVATSIALSAADDACILLRGTDDDELEPNTTYHMVLEPGLASSSGAVLEITISSRFRTAEY